VQAGFIQYVEARGVERVGQCLRDAIASVHDLRFTCTRTVRSTPHHSRQPIL
jgi:hypothetical protein